VLIGNYQTPKWTSSLFIWIHLV